MRQDNLKKINILLSIFSLVFFSLTIFQILKFAEKHYLIKKAEKEINKIENENQKLEDELFSFNQTINLDEFLQKEGFVEAKNVKYIQVFEGTVLAK